MPRTLFAENQSHAEDGVRLLSSRVDKAIADAMEALRTRNMRLAQAVVDGDQAVNEHRYALEEEVLQMMATQAPVASDLRESVSILSIVTDLERMGDHAEGIARIRAVPGRRPRGADGARVVGDGAAGAGDAAGVDRVVPGPG